MARYNTLRTYKNKEGKRYKQSANMKKSPYRDADRYVEAGTFDRLDVIAHNYYGDKNQWWVIALANNLGKGTLYVPSGMILRLPANPSSAKIDESGY